MPANPPANRFLPTGTVTFLFTDIEGSTRLWETQHAAMREALADHDAIVRDAIEANHGCLVKTTGDGAHAAFAIAADALAACLAAQRALTAHAWGGLRIKSRMALHSGAAEERDGDYYGPALNRAARLMAAGHGGQILISLATEELVRDHLPSHTSLRDMGERRLKDLIRPERVYQVVAADLPADFPPLRTLDARPNNLPAQTTPFIGREPDIQAVKKLLSNANVRLLTLSGVGGTGKTRLALQVAADMVDDFEHGVFFVPLAAINDSALVPQAIAQAFGVREAAGRPLLEQLRDRLRDQQVLLVLDNFEQVIDAAPVVSDLLAAAPRLKVLVTSREVLRVSGESEFPVSPLSLPDPKRLPPLARLTQYEAVALFIDRALAVKPSFAVTNENAPAVAEICWQLDGLPLAIELAAARVRVLPPQKMLPALSHRLSFVKGGGRDLPARQKTLRGAIDWSHDLLTGDEQKLFRRLAVFVGGGTLEAIEAICNAEADLPVLETVESLVGKSLLRPTGSDDEPRFAMLETIREFAGEKLNAAGDAEQLRDRHRDYFLAFAETAEPHLTGADQAQWLQRLEADHDNFRASLGHSLGDVGTGKALRLCGSLQRLWWTRGHFSEGREWCRRVLATAGGDDRTAQRAKVLNGAGILAHLQGDYSAARAHHEESLAIRRRLGDLKDIATSLASVGMVACDQGDFDAARRLGEESLALSREIGDRRGIARSLNNLGNVANDQIDYPAAQRFYQECLEIVRELEDRNGIAILLGNLGMLASDQRDFAKARTLHEESLAIMRELGDKWGIANALGNLGGVACDQLDLAKARELHAESLAIDHDLGDQNGIAISLEGLATVEVASGNVLRAASIWGAAERLREDIASPLAPNDRLGYDRHVAAARASLRDDAAFDRAWQDGRALPLDKALALALEETVERP